MALLTTDAPVPAGGVVRTLHLSRPDKRNALNRDQLARLQEALLTAAADDAVRAVLLTGAGKAFCAGYDLDEPFDPAAPDGAVITTMSLLRDLPRPTVAWVHGAAFGAGLELAISADVRVVAPDASFCLPPARLGIAYAEEGLRRLTSLVGTAQARRLALGGVVVDAPEALRIGLGDVPGDLTAAEALTVQLATGAPLAVRHMKATLQRIERVEASGAAHESHRRALFFSADALEGRAAFLERRPPVFRGA